jgi:DinB family protein
MAHPIVEQLRFTRSEWVRALRGVSEEDANRHLGQMNSIGWIVGHLAWHEQRICLERAGRNALFPSVNEEFASGAPMSTPSLKAMRTAWRKITKEADANLDSLTTRALMRDLPRGGKPSGQAHADALRRLTFHYWFHIGEILAIRQMLGQRRLPEYVGNLEAMAPYRPDK